ncbi:alkaline phosphatase [Candidatus Berkelbacteria bacterium CG10_big_fil_rev_8_21_14_0_10_43_13]|uniref:Alkaline phosphatase n=1 Tax=Candidatus Berkelbacteria bacterium CG10_big_fil_rev_8_21_14_0_10_43_13 TaxID=1974514 RepID=A0A2H0W5Q2_9BACT|nr:MAG: alkaline phosphatase [Candidatus Berkelbacteria bacterium CG10_big_fil_rev_8_21_14_0_10_43_13]
MASDIIDSLVQIVISTINHIGYFGVLVLMAAESCGIPFPSEVIMPFAGFAVASGNLLFWPVVIVGAIGNLVGSWVAYWIGYRGGRPLIEKYGKYILISHHDVDLADRWFARFGEWAVFFGRLLPVVRTYISFPAGIAEMNFKKFSYFTFAGAFVWSLIFAWLGVRMGDNWGAIRDSLHSFDLAIVLILVLMIILYVWRHIKNTRKK